MTTSGGNGGDAAAPQITFNEAILHVEQMTGVIELTQEMVDRYIELTGIPKTEVADGERREAPMAMLNVFFTRNQERGADVKLEGATVGLNAGRAIELHTPIYVGDKLTRYAVLQDVYSKTGRSGTMAFEVWEILFRNDAGELVARARDSMVFRAPGVPPAKDGEAGS